MRLLSHIVLDSSGAITAMSNVQKRWREREISTRLNQNMASFTLAKSARVVANTIKKFGIVAAGLSVAVHLVQNTHLTSPVACKQHKRRWRRLTGSTSRRQQGFGQLYNQVLGKPIASSRRLCKQPLHY